MNSCTDCLSRNTCLSADKPMENYIRSLPLETAHHRVATQETKCGFGLQGVCCRLCANGPCRITPDAPRGICGASADTIVARNFLRAVAAGSGCYIHVVENTARQLKNTGLHKDKIRSEKALNHLAELFGVTGEDKYDLCVKVADAVLADLYRPEYEGMELVEKLAYAPRVKKWKELGIMPGGAKGEVFNNIVKTSTNLSSDPVEMLVSCLRLGVSTGLYGLQLTNLLNDVVLGDPEIRPAPVGMNVIDPDYINILITGHQHSLFTYIQDRLLDADVVEKAKAVGAKGFKLVGCTCVGQDLQLRGAHYTEIFDGHAGNNYISEAVLSCGAIDAVLSEFNCTLPGIETICDELKIKQICLDVVAKKANAEYIPFNYETRQADGDRIIDEIIAAYKARRGNVPMNLFTDHGNKNTLTGVSEGSLKAFLGGSWKPLIDLIVAGKIKGLAGVVGCSSVAYGHDTLTAELTKELIAKDILVLTAGCSSGGLENIGLMTPEAAELAGAQPPGRMQGAGHSPGAELRSLPCHRTSGDRGHRDRRRTGRGPAPAAPGPLRRTVAGGAGAGRRRFRPGTGPAPAPGRTPLHHRQQAGNEGADRGHGGPHRRTGHRGRRRQERRQHPGGHHRGEAQGPEYLMGGARK